jgi:Reverse transcriptase (RNA-dependent DNA polymerase)
MGFQDKNDQEQRRPGRPKVKIKAGCKRVFTNSWNWLRRNSCTCGQVYINQDPVVPRRTLRHLAAPNGRCDYLPQWIYQWNHSHGTARGIRQARKLRQRVSKMRKALYGLKQANRQWYAKMDKFMSKDLGFIQNAADNCFYVRIKGGKIRLIALYVDDMLIACNDRRLWMKSKSRCRWHLRWRTWAKPEIALDWRYSVIEQLEYWLCHSPNTQMWCWLGTIRPKRMARKPTWNAELI